jgi:hypothetical protein
MDAPKQLEMAIPPIPFRAAATQTKKSGRQFPIVKKVTPITAGAISDNKQTQKSVSKQKR